MKRDSAPLACWLACWSIIIDLMVNNTGVNFFLLNLFI